ncbi:MAG: excinuclease ABC subunit UvrA, partial [bacterium]
MNDEIVIKGAREHNLKNIDLTIPRDKLVVITGLSGSGKSSLAFDTIYAEGQRRYVESLSAYARQFLEQMDKPDVDLIEGLSPAIAIEQKTTSKNPRSTVGTVTEIHDYLRLLFARVGQPSCHKCGKPITAQTVSQIVDQVMALPEKTRIMVLAPVVRGRKGEYKSLLAGFVREGFVRVRVNGKLHELTEEIELKKHYKHNIDLVVDRLVIKRGIEKRLADSIETSLKQADGIVSIPVLGGEERLYSEKLACIDCGVSYPEISPRSFSFNNPHGACPDCTGLGEKIEIDPELVIPDPRRSISNGAVIAWDGMGGGIDTLYMQKLEAAAAYFRIGLTTPVYQLPPEQQRIILYGSPQKIKFNIKSKESGNKWEWNGIFEGVIPNLERRYKQTSSHAIRTRIHRYMRSRPCPACGGRRLRPESLSIKLGNLDISQVCALSIDKGVRFFQSLELDRNQALIARQVLKEINDRLGFLISVGLDYLTLDRQSGTLSGGEAERIRLATQIGSRLTGVLYILDEPSIGLHQRDNNRLLKTLESLRQMGNSVLVVEHDGETMKAADYLVDMGPEAGIHGGEVVSQGTPQEIMADNASVTGRYLSGKKRIEIPSKRRKPTKDSIRILGASENNLKNIDVTIPLGLFSCLTGVSGSGKSSLAVN